MNPVKRAVPDGITTLAALITTGTWIGAGRVGMVTGLTVGVADRAGEELWMAFLVGEGNKSTFSPSLTSHPLSPSTGFSGESERREWHPSGREETVLIGFSKGKGSSNPA